MNPWKNEGALTEAIVKAIKKRYPLAYVLKIHGGAMQRPGVPDLLCCVEGLWVGLEVKHQKPNESEEYARGRTTPNQQIQIQKINQAGGLAGVVLTPDEALEAIDRAFIKHEEIRDARTHQQ